MQFFYDGTKLLSLKDLNGNKPEIYMVISNRSAGKTTFFSRMLFNRFIKNKEKFILYSRFKDSIAGTINNVISTVKPFFPEYKITFKKGSSDCYFNMYLNDQNCAYVMAINSADKLRNMSNIFQDATSILFDEFQPESNRYCPNELTKFQSLHVSLARSFGNQSRYLPVYMLSNRVSLLNPYFSALGISSRLKDNTKFLRGNGFVVEINQNESAANALQSSIFNTAFSDSSYLDYASTNVYLNDSMSFIAKPKGQSRYVSTLLYNNKKFGVLEYQDAGFMYISDSADDSFPLRLSVTLSDHNINSTFATRSNLVVQTMRAMFNNGLFRFKNLECKDALIKLLSY